jgi:short-subunit dehydrogenase
MGRLDGMVIWITGASSGIGEAVAKACWQEGANLVLSARRTEELQRVSDGLASSAGREKMILQMDVTDTDSFGNLTEMVIRRFGRIDILVNNAGISQRSYAAETPLEVDRRIMEVNFFGTVALTKSVLPHMQQSRSGSIVVISSISGKFGFYLRSAYSASKHALHGFFESLRMEVWKDNVHVMLVCPGKIRTNISLHALKADGQSFNRMDEAQADGLPAEVCAARILKGILRKEEEVFIGGPEMKAVWIKQYFPRLFSRIIRRQKPE